MNRSDKLDVWAKSMFAVQRDLKQPAKDADGAVKGGKAIPYLSLPALIKHLKPITKEHSIFWTQDTVTLREAGGTEIWTTVWTSVGTDTTGPQWVEFGPLFMPHGADAQSTGSAITYGRRYHLLAVFGLAAEDDDGSSASSSPTRTSSEAEPVTSGRDGGEREEGGGNGTPAYGEGASVPPPSSQPDGSDASDMSAHPGKRHVWKPAPDFPGYEMCTVGQCRAWVYVEKEAKV